MNATATVKLLQLVLPPRSAAPGTTAEFAPATLIAWLNTLPLANTAQATGLLLDRLQRANRCVLDAGLRYQSVEVLRPAVDGLIETLKARYVGAALPVSARNRDHAHAVRTLLEEMAYAYKIVITELLGVLARSPADHQHLLDALPRAMNYLGQLILASYLIHETEPAGVWGELQRLYHYAEQRLDAGERAECDGREASAFDLVSSAYLRIAALALANPYHLMPGEADTIYHELATWCALCRMSSPPADSVLAGQLVVDLAADTAPQYCSAALTRTMTLPRVIDLHALVAALDEALEKLPLGGDASVSGASLPMSLSQRLRRDRLLRLKRAWGGRGERKIPRTPRQARVSVNLGLSACHHFIAGEIPFTPERDEVRLHRGMNLPTSPSSALSLVPLEIHPWKLQEESDRLARGVTQSRVSQFDTDSPELDIWRKIHSSHGTGAGERFESAYQTKMLRLKNQGAGGLCLACDSQCQVQTRVGELVAYRSEAEASAEWRIGSMRWLRCQQDGALELGIMRVADEALAVAVRAITGVGAGGEYFRALLSSNGAEAQHESLIVPAAMFDIDTVLAVNLGTEMRYVRLDELLITSTSFTQFDFSPTTAPATELEKIASIKNVRT
ncbi:MAG: hypothetical protein ACYC7I_00375 [Gammaproteobacteria bacterium]